MTARILVVDDKEPNVKLLESRLSTHYFDVITATSGKRAIEICEHESLDIVLLDVMMPVMDGFEVCRYLKNNPKTRHIPVIMVTALDQPSDKVRGLKSGADDFLTKPIDELALVTRIRNLTRLKRITDELIMRVGTAEREKVEEASEGSAGGGRIMLVDDDARSAENVHALLAEKYEICVESNPEIAVSLISNGDDYDLMIVSLDMDNYDALRLCSHIRALSVTRNFPILTMVNPGSDELLARALEIGVNDYVVHPINSHELMARINTQIKHKRYSDHLSTKLEESVEMSTIDPLTGLFNRRYMDGHMADMVSEATNENFPLSVMIIDIDFFKSVNDTYGHDAGDMVLKEFSTRITSATREEDMVCRLGGEEFVLVMPDTDLQVAGIIAERLRRTFAEKTFDIGNGNSPLQITASIGTSSLEYGSDTAGSILKRADAALYEAKEKGRNMVVAAA
jgi:two-component system cell cycle response regulator